MDEAERNQKLDRWRRDVLDPFLKRSGERREHFQTTWGSEVPLVALPASGEPGSLPGEPPFDRGIYPNMYRGRLWTMRQYAGFATCEETNARYRHLLEEGQTGLSVAFDLPTQMGLDSDDPRAEGEVGKVGVAIDTVEDMAILFDGIPLDRVSTSMTINSTAAILLAMYRVVAEERGIDARELGGTVQNDMLKEYIARGTYVFPPEPSLRLVTDVIAYCAEEMPRWNAISISGYHIREAGATAAQELAFTLANGLEYVRRVVERGLDLESFAGRLSFFWNGHNRFFEEVAKLRAARRMWSLLLAERFGNVSARASMMRFHVQTAGSTLTAQQPDNNVVRVAYQALAAVLGGAQSLHTNSRDEALGLPSEAAATLALRTQQILACETGAADSVDPLGGSYLVEGFTDELVAEARRLIDEIDAAGGVTAAVQSGWFARKIQAAAYRHQRAVEAGDELVVGVNCYQDRAAEPGAQIESGAGIQTDPAYVQRQYVRLAAIRRARDADACKGALAALEQAAHDPLQNLVSPILEAVRRRATLGEISGVLRGVFGSFRA